MKRETSFQFSQQQQQHPQQARIEVGINEILTNADEWISRIKLAKEFLYSI